MPDDTEDAATAFHSYQRGCRDRGLELPTWGEWLRQGQPTWIDEPGKEANA